MRSPTRPSGTPLSGDEAAHSSPASQVTFPPDCASIRAPWPNEHKQAAPRPAPRLYLVTPPVDATRGFAAPLAAGACRRRRRRGAAAACGRRRAQPDQPRQGARARRAGQGRRAAHRRPRRSGRARRRRRRASHRHRRLQRGARAASSPSASPASAALPPATTPWSRPKPAPTTSCSASRMQPASGPASPRSRSASPGGRKCSRSPASATPRRSTKSRPLAEAGADFVALGDWLWRDPHGDRAQRRAPPRNLRTAGDRGMKARGAADRRLSRSRIPRTRAGAAASRSKTAAACSRRRRRPSPNNGDADLAYGAFQRGLYLTALAEADQARAAERSRRP